MPTINQLSSVDTISGGDQVPIYSNANGDARKASMSLIKEYVQEDFVPDGGLLAISSYYAMRITTPVSVSLTTTFTNIPNWASPALVLPAGRDSIAGMTTLGEFVAQRDIEGAHFNISLNGTWPTNRDLYLSVYVGTDASPFESTFSFIGAGRGPGAPVTATFSGIAVNLNNPNGTILTGEKIRLVAKFNTSDTLSITKLGMVVQPLDGI